MVQVFGRPSSLSSLRFRYCPGCGHSILHRLLAETIDRLGLREKTIGVSPVGCAVFSHEYLSIDMIEVAHGRSPAAVSAMKRLMPDRIIFSYQGDGDLAAIGLAEVVHAANRGENISVFFVNNASYGMTGGQMAPTTIEGQRTTTTPGGRTLGRDGYPMRVAEMIAALDGPSLVVRTALDCYRNVVRTRDLIEKAFRYQMEGKGFSFVEILSPCPTDWGMNPEGALKWMQDRLIPHYRLGVFKDRFSHSGG